MSSHVKGDTESASVLLYWLPLGAGGRSVRWNGRVFEAFVARHEGRPIQDLYHSALEVNVGHQHFVIEMTPAWGGKVAERGVVCGGPVGTRWLGRSRYFRYEIRCWRDGVIPDIAEAVSSPVRVSDDPARARRLLDMVSQFPTATWGRDELGTGEMWNSNSLVAWLLARTDHEMATICPPQHGRAPGWSAGHVVAARQEREALQTSAARSL